MNISFGAYYRSMRNLVSYINGINAFGFNSKSWREEIDLGKGRSYGLELSGSLQTDKFGSTLAYTYSFSDRTFPNINNGLTFPFKFDRRHNLNLQAKYTAWKYRTKKGREVEHTFNGVLAYSTGNRVTLPVGSYIGKIPPYWNTRI